MSPKEQLISVSKAVLMNIAVLLVISSCVTITEEPEGVTHVVEAEKNSEWQENKKLLKALGQLLD